VTNFSNNVFYTHQQALAVQNSAMKYFPVSILNDSANNSVTGNAKKVNFFLYVNPVYGIKIDYPTSWDKLDFDQSNAYGLVAGFAIPREGKPPSEINVSDFILENVMLGVKSITSSPSPSPSSSSSLPAILNDFVNEQISTYKQRLADFQIIKSNTTPIDNNPTYQIQYTQKDGRATFDTLQIWTISGNKIYTIIFNADPADYPTYMPVIQKMIDSFDVLDDNNTNNSNSNNQMKLRVI
jgi:eukaryotic-like serine/threonine-protein kinase